MSYRIEFKPSATRALRGLSKDTQRRLSPKINALAENPRPHGVEKLSGEENLYRIRVRDYRIIYQIRDKVLLVLVVHVGHRREVYR